MAVETVSKKTRTGNRPRLSQAAAKALPYPDFPLSPHIPTKRWYKTIRGKRHYFGKLDDPDGAMQTYERQRDDLQAGRTPRDTSSDTCGLSVRELANQYLTARQRDVDSGELQKRSFGDYHTACQLLVAALGSHVVDELTADDFSRFRAKLAKGRGPVALGNQVRKIRSVFKWGFETGLMDNSPRWGREFRLPSKSILRKARHAGGVKMFEAEQIRAMLDRASVPLRAMILLGVNAGLGNSDIAGLPKAAIDIPAGVLDFPRPKTGIKRRAILWPETVAAIQAAIDARVMPKDADDDELVFLTRTGKPWLRCNDRIDAAGKLKRSMIDSVALEFDKLAKAVGAKRAGLGFYGLRHTCETIASETLDQAAIDLVMGHESNTMAVVYRERIGDDRLARVSDHLRAWLWPAESKPKSKTKAKRIIKKRATRKARAR